MHLPIAGIVGSGSVYETSGKRIVGGTNYYRTNVGLFAWDVAKFTYASFLRIPTGDSGKILTAATTGNLEQVAFSSDDWDNTADNNQIGVVLKNAGGTVLVQGTSKDFTVHGVGYDEWFPFLFSYDGSGTGTPLIHVYIGDVDVAPVSWATLLSAPQTIDTASGDRARLGWSATETLPLNFDQSEVYLNGDYIDFSVTANRRKFYDTSLKPIYLGDTGELPTGTAAYKYADDGDMTAAVGGHGSWSEVGTVTGSSTSPTD